MRLEVFADIASPREQVFRAYRDELPRLCAGLSNVKEIIVSSRVEDAGVVTLSSLWRAQAEVPAFAQKYVPSWIEWVDHAEWHEASFSARYRTESRLYPPALDSRGDITFTQTPTGTRMHVLGELRFDASKVPGVPRLLAGTASPLVEKFLVARVTPNFTGIARRLELLLGA